MCVCVCVVIPSILSAGFHLWGAPAGVTQEIFIFYLFFVLHLPSAVLAFSFLSREGFSSLLPSKLDFGNRNAGVTRKKPISEKSSIRIWHGSLKCRIEGVPRVLWRQLDIKSLPEV